jgi:hypothetical protein
MFSLVREPFPSKAREGMVLSFEFLGIVTSRNEPLEQLSDGEPEKESLLVARYEEVPLEVEEE